MSRCSEAKGPGFSDESVTLTGLFFALFGKDPDQSSLEALMKKVLRIIASVFLWILAILAELYLLLLAVIHIPPVQDYLLFLVEKPLSQSVQGKVRIGSFRTNLLNSITFNRVRAFSDGSSDSLYIGKLHLDYSLSALFNQEIRFDLVGGENGELNLIRNAQGELLFPLLPKAGRRRAQPDTVKGLIPGPWELVFDSAYLKNFDIAYNDRALDLTSSVSSLSGGAQVYSFDSIQGWLSSNQAMLKSPWWSGTFDTLRLAGIRNDSLIKLDQFLLHGESATLELSGLAPLSLTSHYDVSGTVSAELIPLDRSLFPDQNAMAGTARAAFKSQGTIQSPTISAVITSPYVRFKDYEIDTAFIDAFYGEAESLLVASYLKTSEGEIDLRASVALPGLVLSPSFKGYTVKASADISDLLTILQTLFNLAPPIVKGSADIYLYAQGNSLSELPDTAYAVIAFSGHGPPSLDTARARIILDNNSWQFRAILGSGNLVTGRGKVKLPDLLSGKLQGEISRPDVLSSYFLTYPITGTLSFQGTFRDILKEPAFRAGVQAPVLTWRGVTARDLSASVTYDEVLRVLSSHLFITSNLSEVMIPGVEGLGGMLAAEISAHGTLEDPTVKTQLLINEPRYQHYAGDLLSGELLYKNQTVFWDSLLAVRDSLRLSSSGQLDFLKPQRSIQTALNLTVSGKPTAGLALNASLVNDSFQAKAVIDHLIPGRLISGYPFLACYEGTIATRGVMGAETCLNRGYVTFDLEQFAPVLEEPYLYSGALEYVNSSVVGDIYVSGMKDSSNMVFGVNLTTSQSCFGPSLNLQNGSQVTLTARDFDYGNFVKTFLPGFLARGSFSSDVSATLHNGDWELDGTILANADTFAYTPSGLTASNLSVELHPEGTIVAPRGQYALTGKQVAYGGQNLFSIVARGTVDTNSFNVERLYGDIGEGGYVLASGVIPYVFGTNLGPDAKFSYKLNDVPLTLLNQFLPGVTITEGLVNGGGFVNFGARYNAQGNLEVSKLHIVNSYCDGTWGPVTGTILFQNDTVVLDILKGQIANGEIQAKGFVQLAYEGIQRFGGQLELDNVRFSCEQFLRLGLEEAKVSFENGDSTNLLRANISLSETRVDQIVSVNRVVDDLLSQIPPGPIPAIIENTAVRAVVDLNRNLLVDTNIGRLLLDGQMAVRGTFAQPQFNGILRVVEGQIQYLDRSFDIEEGTLRQFQPFDINPELNIKATTDMQATILADPTDYVITISVRGTLRNPQIELTSYPPLQPQEIVNLLTLGTTTDRPQGFQLRAGEIINSYIVGLGAQILEQALGIDNITVTGNLFSVPEDGGLTLTLRENITSNFSVVYQTQLGNLGNQGVLLSYQLSPQFRIIAESQTEGGAGIGFRYVIRR